MTFPNNGFGRSLNDTPIFPITGLSLMTSCGCNLKWYREALKRGHPKAKRWFIKEFFILLMNTIFFVAAVAILGSSIICIPYIFIKMILKHLG